MLTLSDPRQGPAAAIGPGYVGLSLAVELGKQLDTIASAFAVKPVKELRTGTHPARQMSLRDVRSTTGMCLTSRVEEIADYSVCTITEPSRIDQHRRPNLGPSLASSKTYGVVPKPRDVPDTDVNMEDLVRDVGYQPDTPNETGIANFVNRYKEYYNVRSAIV